jgi:predicted RNase H-like nuclease
MPEPGQSPGMSEQVVGVGVDGARGGWLAAVGYGDGSDGRIERVALELVPTFAGLASMRSDQVPVAVDIPMGLLETVAPRACDDKARQLLGTRAPTVFTPPSRPLLAAASYADARVLIEAERELTPSARGLSAQAFGLAPKMREADEFLRAHTGVQEWLWECHPELSFLALARRAQPAKKLLPNKKSVAGQAERLALLIERFPGVLDALRSLSAGSREARLADALDALVGLDTALRIRTGDCTTLGGETDAAGLIMRMVF